MPRTTIDYGIDLGTTNSTVALIDGTDARPIPNTLGSSITPSAVWIDPRGKLHVGQEAKEHALVDDQGNGDLEFKLRMGLGAEGQKSFQRSGRTMLPEELSAEVLKSLKFDVRTNLGEEIDAAVITVPANFELPQSAATQQAARLAGFRYSPLLLEPVAASLAYGFQSESDNVYWLVYDFGGGTFDAAIMRVRDGRIQVVNHAGDNHLGGKLIDWDIVTMHLVPAAGRKFNLPDFHRGNSRWISLIGKLKFHAEKAKIDVCRRQEPVDIWIENFMGDGRGDFEFTLTPEHVQQVSAPYIARSLMLCTRALSEKNLVGSNMERILMVGGTTLNPWLRERVANELRARCEFGIDPVTVVARGAAIFASTQKLPDAPGAAVPAGTWKIQLEHEPVGNVSDPDIGGRVIPPAGQNASGCTIEFIDTKTRWRTGKITLGSDGIFMTQLHADKKRRCEYRIELCASTGNALSVTPDKIAYTIGVEPMKPPAPHTIGVGMANGMVDPFITKGTPLPTRKMQLHHQATTIHAGNAKDVMLIPVVEGENERAERNHKIGEMRIDGTKFKRDLPAGSEVEITVNMDESQTVQVRAFVPVLDEEFEVSFRQEMMRSSLDNLQQDLSKQKDRLKKAREKAAAHADPHATAALARIDSQRMVDEADGLVQAAREDADAHTQLDRRLLDLRAAIDMAEDAVEWPELVKDARETRDWARGVVDKFGEANEKTRFRALEAELERAIESMDADVLRRYTDEIRTLCGIIFRRRPEYWVWRLEDLIKEKHKMSDQAQADRLIAQARRGIDTNDLESLRGAVLQLRELLPPAERPPEDGTRGTTYR